MMDAPRGKRARGGTLAVAAVALALLAMGLAPGQESQSPLFNANCVRCHLRTGEGGGYAHTMSHPLPANLTLVRDSRTMIGSIVSGGIPGTAMPAFGPLSPEQIDELALTIQSLPQRTFRDWAYPWELRGRPVDLAEARRVFGTECTGCHGPYGAGDGWWADENPHLWPKPANFHARNAEPGRLYHIIYFGREGTMMPPMQHKIPLSAMWSLANYASLLYQAEAPVSGMSDGEWFALISRGVPGTAMPVWEEWLPISQRWHLVRYLQEGFVTGRPTPRSVYEPAALPPPARQVNSALWRLTGGSTDPRRGGTLYATYCAACHGADGRGSGVPPAEAGSGSPAPYPAALPQEYVLWRAREGVVDTIMPQFRQLLADQDLWDVSSYAATLSRGSAAGGGGAAAPAAPASGRSARLTPRSAG